MPKHFHNKLINLLKTDPRFVDDAGALIKAAVIDRAWKIDHALVRLLLGDADTKAKFFEEIDGHWIFNTNTFIDYIADKNFLADSYTRFRNKIGLNIEDKFLPERGEVSLVWPYKDCVLEGGQTKDEEKRKEIFFNEILAQDEIDRLFDPKVLTGWKRYTVDGEGEVTEIKRDDNGVIRENLLIKGNNLLALHTLKQQFRGQVKLIYIDPPYNTGSDSFGYNDSFNHSSWLTFEKNRLEAAKYFLSNSGSIWISIDEREFAYLKILCDEIFGRENHISTVTVKVKDPAGVGQQAPIFDICEYLLVYAKDIKQFTESLPEFADTSPFTEKASGYRNLIVKYGTPKLVQEIERQNVGLVKIYECEDYEIANANELSFDQYVQNRDSIAADYNPSGGMILAIRDQIPARGLSFIEYTPTRGKMAGKLSRVYFLNRRILSFLSGILIETEAGVYRKSKLTNLWDIPNASLHLEGSVEFRNGKKPEVLIKKILSFCTAENDLIMDFHVGSGTTSSVAHKMNRQWIAVEQMDYVETITIERLKNVVGRKVQVEGQLIENIDCDTSGISKSVNWQGEGDFIYCELMPYNQAFMDKIQAAQSAEELVALWRDIAENSFLNWYVNPEIPEDAVKDFIEIGQGENGLEKQKKLLVELLDKNQLYVNLSEIEDADFGVSAEDKVLNRAFYGDSI